MQKHSWLWMIFLCGPASLLMAQTPAEIPEPKPPILERAPTRSEWIITYQYDRQKSNEGGSKASQENKPGTAKQLVSLRPTETQVSKDGKTYREITTWSDGHKSEKWITEGMEVQDSIQGTVTRIMPPGAFYVPNYSDYSHSDFEDVQWISLKNYVGTYNLNGATVYHFETPADKRALTAREKLERESRDHVQNKADTSRNYVAYLDIHTQRPLYLDDGEVIRSYSYPKNSSGELVPPPKFAQALESWKKESQRKTVAPPSL